MKKLNQEGTGHIEALVTLIVVLIIGGSGAYIYKNKDNHTKTANPQPTATTTQQTKTATPKKEENKQPETMTFLDISEWKVRISFADADKVTYKIVTDDEGKDFANLFLKDKVTTIEDCRPLGVGFGRTITKESDTSTKVGNYYYELNGGPGACNEPGGNGPINQLRAKITGDELGGHKYSLTSL